MKKTTVFMNRVATAALLLVLTATVWAANKKTTVTKVTTTVTLTDDVDYHISSDTPFEENGIVNIVNTDHAVLILDAMKPSLAQRQLNAHVQINGDVARNGTNCQVKLYNRGAIILPYTDKVKPLTVYSEKNFEGESYNEFNTGSTDGFMNTLTTKQLNNRIRSFKLKRGYMVTFANRASGRGYSRCFIAADKDLEIASLPGILDRSISSYRIFRWYDTGKQGLANDTRAASVSALNVTSCYSFGLGENRGMDCECVPHHIYEDWPSAAECGKVTYSPHLKTNNEPGNSADDHPQTVKEILNNWENLMRTGMRLCSPSSHDGSLAHLREFMDSIDARGWRCDIIDLHCYWPESSFNEWSFKTQWVDKYHRPIWISEWVWGASWNSNGAFASGVTEAQNRDAVKRICEKLNGWDYIERYYYWNSERDPSRIYKDKLTVTGEYYASINSGLGYNGKYDFAPKVPTQRDPGQLTIEFDKEAKTAVLKWYEYNGEMNVSMTVKRKRGNGTYEEIADITRRDTPSNYTYTDNEAMPGDMYQVVIIDANNKERKTNEVTAASFDHEAGEAIEMEDGSVKYLGGNVFVNGDFDLGFYSWTDGKGDSLAAPFFQVPAVGSIDGGSYLQAYGHGTGGSTANYNQALKTVFSVEPNSDYYFSGSFCNGSSSQYLYKNTDGTSTDKYIFSNNNRSDAWDTQFKTFNTEENDKVLVFFRQLLRKAQVDKLTLCKLFNTREEAIADAVAKAKLRAEAIQGFNTISPALNADLARQIESVYGTDENALNTINEWNAKALKAYKALAAIDSMVVVGEAVAAFQMDGYDTIGEAITQARSASNIDEIISAEAHMRVALSRYMLMKTTTGKLKNPKFATNANSWTTVCGTFTGGDQRRNTFGGVTFWNAWWSGINASEGDAKTMEIKQEISGLPEGYYALQCDAMTEHYCLSDQHAFITSGDVTAVSPVLTADYMDLPTVNSKSIWQTLTTTPVHVDEGGSIVVGFKSSKAGAIDNAWHQVGGDGSGSAKDVTDKREGWWGATNFVLLNCTSNYADGIVTPFTAKKSASDGLYTLDGRSVQNDSQIPGGVYIRISNGKARKEVVK